MTTENQSTEQMADDYVLGLLGPLEEKAVEALLHDPALQAAIAASRDRFVELDMTAEPLPVSEDMWARISSRLDQTDPQVQREEPQPEVRSVVAPPAAANSNETVFWRKLALLGTAASVLLAAGLTWSLQQSPSPQIIAVLLDTQGQPQVLVEDYGNSTAKIIPLTTFNVPADRTMQVWTLPSAELGPVSLGLLPSSETAILDGPSLPLPHENQLYEITIEQKGGSPTGRPTGPILVKGYSRTAK